MKEWLSWEYRANDGVRFSCPQGFLHGYYIYPPNKPDEVYYDNNLEDSNCYTLELIAEDGTYDITATTRWNSLEEAKQEANRKFGNIIKPFILYS